jgi:glyoxylase-like metal-dependent hydrolase (beta-lactamase superfamily II)
MVGCLAVVIEDPFEIAPATFCIATDYPEVADAPLWLYLLADPSGACALIDCGVPSTYERALARALPMVDVDPGQIEWIVLTHGHPDHMGGHPGLRGHAPFKVAAPLEDVIWVEAVARQWHDFWDCYPGAFSLEAERDLIVDMCGGDLAVDRILRDGELFELGRRRLEVVLTRGHTRGHCALFERETGLLFCGDDVQVYGIPSTSRTSVFAPLYGDVDDYLHGLERLRALPFSQLCSAHHLPVAHAAGLELLDRSIAFVHEVDALVRGLLERASGPLVTAEVATAIGELCGTNPPVTIQTVTTATAHLNHAARAGLVRPQWAPARTTE